MITTSYFQFDGQFIISAGFNTEVSLWAPTLTLPQGKSFDLLDISYHAQGAVALKERISLQGLRARVLSLGTYSTGGLYVGKNNQLRSNLSVASGIAYESAVVDGNGKNFYPLRRVDSVYFQVSHFEGDVKEKNVSWVAGDTVSYQVFASITIEVFDNV